LSQDHFDTFSGDFQGIAKTGLRLNLTQDTRLSFVVLGTLAFASCPIVSFAFLQIRVFTLALQSPYQFLKLLHQYVSLDEP